MMRTRLLIKALLMRILPVFAMAIIGASAASATTIFVENFESYAPGSNLIGQGGWFPVGGPGNGPIMPINVGSYLVGSKVVGGFDDPGTGALTFAKRLFDVNAGPTAKLTLKFDAFAISTAGKQSYNDGVYFSTASEPLAVGWFMTQEPRPNEWIFDARGITGVDANLQYFSGGFNTPVALEVIVDPVNLVVYGRYNFGTGFVTTPAFAITAAQVAAIDGITTHQDYRSWNVGVGYVGAEFDNLIVTAVVEASIDIMPGSFPNSINPRSMGVIPVAILTTDSFDAATVDPSTVRFGATGAETAPVYFALQDVDRDGDIDLILHFDTQATGIQCGDSSASLTGKTFSGQTIKGSDSVKTAGCK